MRARLSAWVTQSPDVGRGPVEERQSLVPRPLVTHIYLKTLFNTCTTRRDAVYWIILNILSWLCHKVLYQFISVSFTQPNEAHRGGHLCCLQRRYSSLPSSMISARCMLIIGEETKFKPYPYPLGSPSQCSDISTTDRQTTPPLWLSLPF